MLTRMFKSNGGSHFSGQTSVSNVYSRYMLFLARPSNAIMAFVVSIDKMACYFFVIKAIKLWWKAPLHCQVP